MSFFYIHSRNPLNQTEIRQIKNLILYNKSSILHEFNTEKSYFLANKKESSIANFYDGKLIAIGDINNQNGNSMSNVISNYERFDSFGKYSCDNLYGDYILIGIEQNSSKMHFFRSLCSRKYMFYYQDNETLIVTTSVKLIFDFLKRKPTIYLPYIVSYIKRHFIESPQTAFENVYEIMRGCTIEFSGVKISSNKLRWNPVKNCRKSINHDSFKDQMIFGMNNIINSNLKNADKIVLDFSGGFDSTTLLHFIKEYCKEGQQIIPINFFEKTVSSSNELYYAKKITNSLGLQLEELDLGAFLPFSKVDYAKENIYPNWPTSSMMYHKKMLHISKNFLQKTVSKNENIIYLSGHGGDNIFMCPTFFESLVDYYLDNGLDGLNNMFKEFFLLNRDPFFANLVLFMINYIKYKTNYFMNNTIATNPKKETNWIVKGAFELDKSIKYHPIEYENLGLIHPGKKKLLKSIVSGLYTIKCNLTQDSPICRYPFFSENMINLCLSFPTYNSFKKGYDRYHARNVISNHFKTDQVWRKDKGETTGLLQKGFAANSYNLIELCMEGICVKNKLVDKNLLYNSLKSLEAGVGDNNWPISSLITAEIFCEIWR